MAWVEPVFLSNAPQAEPNGCSHREVRSAFTAAVALWKCHKEGGAAYRTRTCDPRITNAMLYQLS
jgi:hypothetical protein